MSDICILSSYYEANSLRIHLVIMNFDARQAVPGKYYYFSIVDMPQTYVM